MSLPAPQSVSVSPDVNHAESIATRLAKNLVAARIAAEVTQLELANKADVSRATIAQVETGICDPKLSTVVQLANALGINSLLLTLGRREIEMLAEQLGGRLKESTAAPLLDAEVKVLGRLMKSGMLKDRAMAARVAADAARRIGLGLPAIIGAAIGGPIEPGRGTAVGALLGLLLRPEGGVTDLTAAQVLLNKVTSKAADSVRKERSCDDQHTCDGFRSIDRERGFQRDHERL